MSDNIDRVDMLRRLQRSWRLRLLGVLLRLPRLDGRRPSISGLRTSDLPGRH